MKSDSFDDSAPTFRALVTKPLSGSTLVNCVVVAAVVLLIAGLTAPMVIRCPKKANQTEAVNNARQIGMALFEFQNEYGKFPDANTITAVRQSTSTDLNLGTKSSNDYFRQLLAAGVAQSEPMFYSQIAGTRKPDNHFTQAEALKKGECGFTYLVGPLKTDNPGRPILITPMIPGTDRFDPKPFKGKAVMLRLDNSVTSMTITDAGHIRVGGMDLMDPSNPIWNGHPPAIAWPE